MSLWRWLIAWLVWLSADPVEIDVMAARAAAAGVAARASLLQEAPSPPAPAPKDCDCGQTCVRGVWKPDGRVEQVCRCECERCKRERSKGKVPETAPACPDGKCPTKR